ncbi:MAG TPA: hypothetical protein VF683_11765 [Chthoniobacterales bacterium]|jgi:hypothetical protein
MPFARGHVRLEQPLNGAREGSDEEFEAVRARLQRLMTDSMLMDGAPAAH